MNKAELKKEYKEALANYLEPIALNLNTTRTALGLPPADITQRAGIEHQVKYFEAGFKDGTAGYYDRWYDDKKAATAYQQGNYAGREFCGDTFQVI